MQGREDIVACGLESLPQDRCSLPPADKRELGRHLPLVCHPVPGACSAPSCRWSPAIAQGVSYQALAEQLADHFSVASLVGPILALGPPAQPSPGRPPLPAGLSSSFAGLCDAPFTPYELHRSKRKSASGADGLTLRMLRNLDAPEQPCLLDAFNSIWDSRILPESWSTAIALPIRKARKPPRALLLLACLADLGGLQIHGVRGPSTLLLNGQCLWLPLRVPDGLPQAPLYGRFHRRRGLLPGGGQAARGRRPLGPPGRPGSLRQPAPLHHQAGPGQTQSDRAVAVIRNRISFQPLHAGSGWGHPELSTAHHHRGPSGLSSQALPLQPGHGRSPVRHPAGSLPCRCP
ncbi:uncharacterized protein LOC144110561 [Amblyomma americanum]